MATEGRTSSTIQSSSPGPFLAKVVSHLDTTYMGTLEVELLKTTDTGNNAEATGQLLQASYLSPFYGVTPFRDTTDNEGSQYSQSSYGMWMVPPDVGTIVMVIKVEGRDDRAFWIGCVQDQYMNFNVPNGGQAVTEFNDQNPRTALPVGEYNKRSEDAAGRNPTQFVHPVNEDFANVLREQGLDGCRIRGQSTSSARREAPSSVFGISTPGPQDRRPGAPRSTYGRAEGAIEVPFNRLGGTSLVMDDGDPAFIRASHAGSGPPTYINREAGETGGDPTIPANELFRIRTRTGHQILLHNSEDLIYIANSRGTAWIEMTSNGKIDIYGGDSISIHTEGDFNVKADGNINMQADGAINLKSSGDMNADGATINLNSGSAAESGRVPEHEPWSGHESNFGESCNLTDTFRQRSSRSPNTEPTQTEADAETTSGGSTSTADSANTNPGQTTGTALTTPEGGTAADLLPPTNQGGIPDNEVSRFTSLNPDGPSDTPSSPTPAQQAAINAPAA